MNESGEMYLESIYILCNKKPSVRSIDVAEYMNYSKPSVSRGMSLLKKSGLITINKDGHINLTEAGESKAKKIFDRHTTLTKLLIYLGVDGKIASEDACRIEHVISDESFEAIKTRLEEVM